MAFLDRRPLGATTSATRFGCTPVAGDQAFTYIGNLGFTGVAGQLRNENNGIFSGDVNGAGVPDFKIQIDIAAPLASAFIL